jgi:hypothetical protein
MRPADRHGSMCEWATAFGLSMRTTSKRFGPIDGKPRDAGQAKYATPAQPLVEVVDMDSAVKAAAAMPEPPARRASDHPARARETTHA